MENQHQQYVCPKCGCTEFEHDQFQATGGNFAKIFDIQNKRFITISCAVIRNFTAPLRRMVGIYSIF